MIFHSSHKGVEPKVGRFSSRLWKEEVQCLQIPTGTLHSVVFVFCYLTANAKCEIEVRWVAIKPKVTYAFIPKVFDVRWCTFTEAWMAVWRHC